MRVVNERIVGGLGSIYIYVCVGLANRDPDCEELAVMIHTMYLLKARDEASSAFDFRIILLAAGHGGEPHELVLFRF